MGIIYAENGTVLRSFTGKNQRSTVDRHLSQTELTQKGDSQTVENWQHAGFRSIPPVNSRQFVDCFSNHYRASTAEDDKIVHSGLSVGELIIYSSAAGSIVGSLTITNGGAFNIVAPLKVTINTDVIANLVSLVEHHHTDSWGKPTSAPLAQGAPDPAVPATVTIESDIDLATNGKKIDGKEFLPHTHGGVTTGAGSTAGVN